MKISRTTLLATAVAIFAASAWLYWPSVHGEFLDGDDTLALRQSFRLNGLTWRALKWELTYTVDYYQPLARLSHVVDYQLFGENPLGHHVMSIALHSFNATLVFGFLWSLLSATPFSANERFTLALGTTLIFAIHPFQTESVAWLAGRTQVLCTTFGIASLWVYVTGGKRWLVFVLFLLAMMSKPMAVSFPFILLAIDYYPLRRYQQLTWGRLLWEKTPLFAVAFVASLATIFTKAQSNQVATLAATPLSSRLLLLFVSLSFYPCKLLWPSHLSPDFPLDSTLAFAPRWAWASVIFVVAITLVVVMERRHWPMLVACWASYLALILPVSGLVTTASSPILTMRYAYVAMLPILLAIGAALICVWRRSNTVGHLALAGLLAALLCAFAAGSRHLIPIWRDDESRRGAALAEFPNSDLLNRDYAMVVLNQGNPAAALKYAQRDVQVVPNVYQSHGELALVLARLGRGNEALAQAEEAYRLNPRRGEAEVSLGVILLDLGKPSEAVYHFQQALRIQPDTPTAHYNLGYCLCQAHQLPEAASQFEAELKINPNSYEAHNGLGGVLLDLGDLQNAIAHYNRALQLNPDLVEAHYNLGLALARTGRLPEATKQWEDVLMLKPTMVEAHVCLAEALEKQDKVADATRQYELALAINPDFAEAHSRLGAIFQRSGKLPEAAAQYELALRINPDDTDTQFNFALALEKLGRTPEAIQHYQLALHLQPDLAPAKDALARLQSTQ
ncbi:MAG TPA: tetratricopeptide repeat protein [Verrucomicrobiae bacterium]|nr:tetratricopeptide repeat protein [Verrucomicrobiae bacterium]